MKTPAPLALAFLLSGCAAAPVLVDGPQTRPLTLERFFAGRTVADGGFVSALTGAERKVHVLLDGKWDGRVLRLFEDFYYADGERVQKTWVLTRTGPSTWSGTREDVIGTAHGAQEGARLRLTYDAKLPVNGGIVAVTFNDLLELRADGTVLNKAVVSKLGVKLGDVTLVIRRSR